MNKGMTDSETLADLRKQIDTIDEKIVRLVDQRAAIAKRVGATKGGGPIYRPAREAEVLDRVVETSSGELPVASLIAIYREIIAACRNVQ